MPWSYYMIMAFSHLSTSYGTWHGMLEDIGKMMNKQSTHKNNFHKKALEMVRF